MELFDLLSYAVTALGVVLCIFSAVFIFLGKRIEGGGGKPQEIKFKGLEVRTNTIIMLLIMSVFPAVLPLYLQFSLKEKGIDGIVSENRTLKARVAELSIQASKLPQQSGKVFMNGVVRDGTGKLLEGAKIKIIKTAPAPETLLTTLGPTADDGHFLQDLPFNSAEEKLEVVAEMEGYAPQKLILGKDMVTFPAVLVKRK